MNIQTLQTIAPKITEDQYTKLKYFVDIFLEKNKVINLSAIRDEEKSWNLHIYDSLASIQVIEDLKPKTIVDMGTGGGFPTIPLSICLPDEIQFFPLDSVQKKLKAVEEFAHQLDLKNINLLWGRAEEYGRNKKYREQYDMVVTRAFAKFAPMLEMCFPLIKEKGYLLSYRGPETNREDDEIIIDYFGGFTEEIYEYTLPNGEQRELWKIKKVEPTEKKYPREVSIPKNEPITVEIAERDM